MRTPTAVLISAVLFAASAGADMVLHDFEGDLEAMNLALSDVELKLVKGEEGKALRIDSGHKAEWPGINWAPPDGKWDLSAFLGMRVDVRNVGENPVQIGLRIDNEGGDGAKNCNQKIYGVKPGEAKTLELPFIRRMDSKLKLFGMRGYPGNLHSGPHSVDPSRLIRMFVFVPRPKEDHSFTIDSIRAYGKYEEAAIDPEKFFPFIDEFGQYIHKDWPGKTGSVKQMRRRLEEETRDLKRHPGPKKWNKYGGWLDGPQLEATGHFYPKKYRGKWWLVDPEGRLFFSHGIDCVGVWADSPVDERETWYRDFPGDREEYQDLWGETSNVVRDYYKGRKVRHFNWAGVNVRRKYGEDSTKKHYERAHVRIRSWGMNTIGNWSDHNIFTMKRTPYVVAVHHWGTALAGSEGYWAKFRDVFAPDFSANLKERLAWHKTRTAGDPYLIGYFIDNEISWGNKTALAVATLASPASQPAKRVFLDGLKKKYSSIRKLNRAWGTDHASWDALLDSQEPPDQEKAKEDLEAFTDKTADTYFRKCREAVKEIAPHNLYLGPRFAWVNDLAFKAAAKHCDVVSYNLYWRDVSGFKLPGDADYPVIIGEWHAGALDRGMFMPGLIQVENQKARGEFYRDYATGVLRNPLFVGCHWFQYRDQATTGRSLDGENYQIGFVDICDTPYPETIAAAREVGYRLYEIRSGD